VDEDLKTQKILEKYPNKVRSTRIPFGYIRKEGGDPNLLVPDPAVIPLLDAALDQLDAGTSLRQVSEWLNHNLPEGIQLSHSGLDNLRKEYRPGSKPKKLRPVKKLTAEEKAEKRRRFLIGQEKKRIAHALKRAKKLEQEIETIKENKVSSDPSLLVELDYSHPDFDKIEEEVPVVFKPNPGPQTAFFAADEQEVLYGGAAGGGKSYALIADPMRYFDNKNFRGLILRRTNDELRELIWKSQELYPQIWDKAVWREKDKEWRFPSGARLWMTYLERDEDVLRYQGQSFSYIGFDELTQYPTPKAWDYMRSRLRTTDPSLPIYMRATSNPGGPGHGWVKRMFIDPAPAGTSFNALDMESGTPLVVPVGDPDFPEERWGKALFQRRFIPAKLADNPYLTRDGQYKSNLLSLRTDLQRQLLDGDWNVADGAAFGEFRESIHTCVPFKVPEGWRKFRSCDYGYASYSAVHWYAIDPDGLLYVYRELYVTKKTGKELAHLILDAEKDDRITYGVLDSSVWAMRGQAGPSIAEEMIAAGCRWRPSDRTQGSRTAGKNRLHELLKVNPVTGKPGIIFFNTCRQIISDLPIIPVDPDGEDDIDDRYASDHAYDSIRYGIMSRPRPVSMFDFTPNNRTYYTPSDSVFGY
jgi:hypothetical protein